MSACRGEEVHMEVWGCDMNVRHDCGYGGFGVQRMGLVTILNLEAHVRCVPSFFEALFRGSLFCAILESSGWPSLELLLNTRLQLCVAAVPNLMGAALYCAAGLPLDYMH